MWRKWAWLGVALFVALDVVLVAWAVDHTRGTPPDYVAASADGAAPGGAGTAVTAATSSPVAPSTSSSAAETTPASSSATTPPPVTTEPPSTTQESPAADPSALDPAGTVLMDMANDGSVIRAVRGSCAPGDASDGAAPSVAISHDFGETWEDVPAEVTEQAHAVVRVAARGGSRSWFVTADEDCELTEHDANAGATDWSTSSPEGAWALPTDALAEQLVAPDGVVDIDCAPRYIAAIDAKNAVVACADGRLTATADSGASWADVAAVPGVVAISFVGTNTGYALAASQECAVQVLTTSDGAESWTEAACLDGTRPEAITAAGSTVLAMVDGEVRRSDDKGVTW